MSKLLFLEKGVSITYFVLQSDLSTYIVMIDTCISQRMISIG